MRLSRCMSTLGAGMGLAMMLTVGGAKFAQADCGDGVTTAGEGCDNGTAICRSPAKNVGAECAKSSDCLGTSTGVLGGAGDLCTCDLVRNPRGCNRDDVGGACRSNCMPPMCGDGVSDPGEQCDPGASTSTSGRCLGNVPNSVCVNGGGALCHGGGGNAAALVGCTNDGQCAIFPGCGGTCTGNPACQLAQCGDKFVCSDVSCTSGSSFLNSPAGAPGPEGCDDGNTSNMDACTPFGFLFTAAGTPAIPDACQANICGDGATNMGVEQCDSGIALCLSGPKATIPPSKPCCSNDDCGLGSLTGLCSAALGLGNGNIPDTAGTCGGHQVCRCNCNFPSCGDGISDSCDGEQCDDGTTSNGPGKFCNKVKRCVGGENPGALCTDNSTCTKGTCGPVRCEENVCGDDTIGGFEQCDDSNATLPTTTNGDTCGVTATLAAGLNAVLRPGCNTTLTGALANQPTACIQGNCALPLCGDGVTEAGEMCDAGFSICSAALAAANGVTLNNPNALCCQASDCKVSKTAAGTTPDVCAGAPGNRNDLPNSCRCNCMPPSCGDGVSDTGEQCEPPASGTFCIKNAMGMCVLNTCGDDDVCNKAATDACATESVDILGRLHCAAGATARLCTTGPSCVLDPTTGMLMCTPGGGAEQCDDSNTINPSTTNTDTCSNICQGTSCGDGVTEANEQCDPPAGASKMGCSNMVLAGEGTPDCCIDGEVVAPGKQIAAGLISVSQGFSGLDCRMQNLVSAAGCDAWLMKAVQRQQNKVLAAEVNFENDDITRAQRILTAVSKRLTALTRRITRVTQVGAACAGKQISLTEQVADAKALSNGIAGHLTEEVATGFGP